MDVTPKKEGEDVNGEKEREGRTPSVIFRYAQYNVPSDDVSRIVTTNDPSTFEFAPCSCKQPRQHARFCKQ
jgi:hypothetical protein